MFGSVGKAFQKVVETSTGKTTLDALGGGNAVRLIPGIGDAMAADDANRANAKFAQAQMDFQERMSNTAYQRAMDDMKKAGLNPMLAFSQGGASAPAGAAPTIAPASRTKLAEFALSSALGVRGANQQQQTIDNQIQGTQSQIDLNKSTAAKQIADTQNTQADTALKQRELRGKGMKETLDRKGGEVIQKIMDSLSNSAQNNRLMNNIKQMDPRNWSKEKKQQHDEAIGKLRNQLKGH